MTISADIRNVASSMPALPVPQPGVTMSCRDADGTTVAAMMFVAIAEGVNSARGLFDLLAQRDVSISLGMVQFILDAFTGKDRRHCLWTRTPGGRYEQLSA